MATKFANSYGGMPEADCNAAVNAFNRALKLMQQHKLGQYFRKRCEALFLSTNLDGWYIDLMEFSYYEYFPEYEQ